MFGKENPVMEVMTIRSEAARMQWRETIDAAYVDKKDVIIERYGKPVVTMIAHAKWQQILNRLEQLEFAARAIQDYKEMRDDPSLIVSEEEYQTILEREGQCSKALAHPSPPKCYGVYRVAAGGGGCPSAIY
jgi:hypothetical protein